MKRAAAFLIVCICAIACRGAERPVVTLNVASVSEHFSAAFSQAQKGGFRADVTFVADDEIAVTSVQGPLHGATQLSVDFFRISGTRLILSEQQTLAAEMGHPELVALPNGGYLINQGLRVAFFNSDHREIVSRSVADLCGMDTFEPLENHDLLSRVRLPFARDEAVLFVDQISRDKTSLLLRDDSKPHTDAKPLYCWFNTKQGKAIAAVVGDPPVASNGPTTNDDAIISRGYLTPFGRIPLRLHCDKDQPALDMNYLLHAVKGELLVCSSGDLIISANGSLQTKRFGRKSHPAIAAESLHAPLIVVSINPISVGLFGGMSSSSHAEIFDYARRSTVLRLYPDDLPHQPGYSVTLERFALSPTGKYLAVLNGSQLTVYKLSD